MAVVSPSAALLWEGTAALGPILVEDNTLHVELTQVPEPVPQLQTEEETRAGKRCIHICFCWHLDC